MPGVWQGACQESSCREVGEPYAQGYKSRGEGSHERMHFMPEFC